MRQVLLDTNIILRFLLNDHPTLSQKAKRVFRAAEKGRLLLFINHTTFAEVFWVLIKFYKIPKKEVLNILVDLLNFPNLNILSRRFIQETLFLLERFNVSYVDAYNIVYANQKDLELLTFDKKLHKIYLSFTKG